MELKYSDAIYNSRQNRYQRDLANYIYRKYKLFVDKEEQKRHLVQEFNCFIRTERLSR